MRYHGLSGHNFYANLGGTAEINLISVLVYKGENEVFVVETSVNNRKEERK